MNRYLSLYDFDDIFSSCIVDGMDTWDAIWYTLNYLPS